jgi:hypothetical protein
VSFCRGSLPLALLAFRVLLIVALLTGCRSLSRTNRITFVVAYLISGGLLFIHNH